MLTGAKRRKRAYPSTFAPPSLALQPEEEQSSNRVLSEHNHQVPGPEQGADSSSQPGRRKNLKVISKVPSEHSGSFRLAPSHESRRSSIKMKPFVLTSQDVD